MRHGLSFVSWMSALSLLVFIPVSAWAVYGGFEGKETKRNQRA